MSLLDAAESSPRHVALVEAATVGSWTYAELRDDGRAPRAAIPARAARSCSCAARPARDRRSATWRARRPSTRSACSTPRPARSMEARAGRAHYEPALRRRAGRAGTRAAIGRRPGAPRCIPTCAAAVHVGLDRQPKLVRLSTRQRAAATRGPIAAYLELDARERAITSLPLHYSYGLSVLNSHLPPARPWCSRPQRHPAGVLGAWRRARVTSLAGVPVRLRDARALIGERDLPGAAHADAGRRPAGPRAVAASGGSCATRERRFFVMYGQTEATARIAYVPPERLARQARLDRHRDPRRAARDRRRRARHAPDVDGRVVYRGPNVMLGYASDRADLARGDELGGVLRTGDLGQLDDDGFLSSPVAPSASPRSSGCGSTSTRSRRAVDGAGPGRRGRGRRQDRRLCVERRRGARCAGAAPAGARSASTAARSRSGASTSCRARPRARSTTRRWERAMRRHRPRRAAHRCSVYAAPGRAGAAAAGALNALTAHHREACAPYRRIARRVGAGPRARQRRSPTSRTCRSACSRRTSCVTCPTTRCSRR